jgi:hypothetical protein
MRLGKDFTWPESNCTTSARHCFSSVSLGFVLSSMICPDFTAYRWAKLHCEIYFCPGISALKETHTKRGNQGKKPARYAAKKQR